MVVDYQTDRPRPNCTSWIYIIMNTLRDYKDIYYVYLSFLPSVQSVTGCTSDRFILSLPQFRHRLAVDQ